MKLLELNYVKIKKFEKAFEEDDIESLGLNIVMWNIPRNDLTIELIASLIANAIVLSIDNQPAILWRRMCGSSTGKRFEFDAIDAVCLYKLPKLFDNYIVFECFDDKCLYHFKISIQSL